METRGDPARFADLNDRISRRLDRDVEVEPRLTRRSVPQRFVCTVEHAAARYDDALWATLTFVGIQNVPADEDDPGFRLELRNCSCGTTLSRVIDAAVAA